MNSHPKVQHIVEIVVRGHIAAQHGVPYPVCRITDTGLIACRWWSAAVIYKTIHRHCPAAVIVATQHPAADIFANSLTGLPDRVVCQDSTVSC